MSDAVQEVLRELERAWNTGGTDRFEPLWDLEDPSPFYLAEEEAEPATTWPALRDYWRRTAELNEQIRVAYSDVLIKAEAETAVALWRMRWTIKLKPYPAPLGGENRVMANLRRTRKGWKLHSYIEAPLAPISYIRKLYERDAARLPLG